GLYGSGDAAVGVDDLAVDPPARPGQEGDHLGDVRGSAQAPERGAGRGLGDGLLVSAAEEHGGGGPAPGDRVDRDVAAAQLSGEDERQALDGRLAGGVGGGGRDGPAGQRGGEVDDGAAAAQPPGGLLAYGERAADVGAVDTVQVVQAEVGDW